MQQSNQNSPKPSSSRLRCAIYTRKSTEEGLDQEFNSLEAQREAAEAFIRVSGAKDGSPCPNSTTMAASPEPTWTGPP